MDEGMPWRIILIFFFLGAFLGARAERKLKDEHGEQVFRDEESN